MRALSERVHASIRPTRTVQGSLLSAEAEDSLLQHTLHAKTNVSALPLPANEGFAIVFEG